MIGQQVHYLMDKGLWSIVDKFVLKDAHDGPRVLVFFAEIYETFVLKCKRHFKGFQKLEIFLCFIFGPKWSIIVLVEVSLPKCIDAAYLVTEFAFVAQFIKVEMVLQRRRIHPNRLTSFIQQFCHLPPILWFIFTIFKVSDKREQVQSPVVRARLQVGEWSLITFVLPDLAFKRLLNDLVFQFQVVLTFPVVGG